MGIRGARVASRGPMWVSFLHTLSWASWPRTFVAGLFDTPETEPAVPALVPAPDWLRMRVTFDRQPVLIHSGELLAHSRTLDLRRGLMITEWHQRDAAGRILRWRALRLVSIAERAVGMQVVQLSVEGGPVEVTLEADLELVSSGLELVHRTPQVTVWETASSGKQLAIASHASLYLGGEQLEPRTNGTLQRSWTWTAAANHETATFCRVVAVARGDTSAQNTGQRARTHLARAKRISWPTVFRHHVDAWQQRWDDSDLVVEGDEEAQRALRFAIYHLNGAANPDDEHVSIGARGLTGDAYLGHVFWDTEIYVAPFYMLTWPAAARALLMYRFHTLDAARAKAARFGCRGALYAWESADTGEETTPDLVMDSRGKIIEVPNGRLEQHISADIAYAVWRYWQTTGDTAFLQEAGAEILLETARFWASRAKREADGCYHIRHVIGPDEYHEDIDDNAFTNQMAVCNIERALESASVLQERWPETWTSLSGRLELTATELERWREVAGRLVTGFDPRRGLFEQFAGYFGLEDIDLREYEGRTVPMDVVLGHERTQASQVIKQADVVALLALLPERFAPDVQAANFAYYEPRCGHGSSLSRGLHAVVAARLGLVELAERYFRATAALDLEDRSGASNGGIRIAALGALWQTVVFGFSGVTLCPDGIALSPHLPASWQGLAYRLHWRGRVLHVRFDQRARSLTATLEQGAPMRLCVDGQQHTLQPQAALRLMFS